MDEVMDQMPPDSGVDGWRKLLWKHRMPAGHQSRPSRPALDTSRLVPGHLWETTLSPSENAALRESVIGMEEPPLVWGHVQPHQAPTENSNSSTTNHLGDDEDNGLTATSTLDRPASRGDSFTKWNAGPLIPNPRTHAYPKQAVQALYDKHMPETPVTDEAYFLWNKIGDGMTPPFTCVLVCPSTYEIFPAGRFEPFAQTKSGKKIDLTVDEKSGIVWYSRKKEAAHGAAALRFDCWYYREMLKQNPEGQDTFQIGKDQPYDEDDERSGTLRSYIPDSIFRDIQAQIAEWQEAAVQRQMQNEAESIMEQENVAIRDDYIEARR